MEKRENKYYVYAHYNPIKNEIFYIGKGFKDRAYRTKCRNKFWKLVVEKHGYEIQFLHNNLSESEAIILEIYYINKIGRRDCGKGPLVNLTDGGEGSSGYIMTQEHKNKIGEKLKGRIFSDEHRKRNIESKIGKKRSESTKKKLSFYRTGKKLSDETKKKIIASLKGRKHSEGTKLKIKTKNIGKIVSDKTKEILKNRKECKKVIQLGKDDNFINEYRSIRDAARINNLDMATIWRCCHKKSNTAGGFKWKFA